MARSSYIYLAMGMHGPLAAFTVKHELVTWLGRQPAFRNSLEIRRMRDGGVGEAARFLWRKGDTDISCIESEK